MERRDWKRTVNYTGLLALAFIAAVAASYALILHSPADNAAYDFMSRRYHVKSWNPQSILLAIDDDTLQATPGGGHGIRKPLARALKLVAAAKPKAVAVD